MYCGKKFSEHLNTILNQRKISLYEHSNRMKNNLFSFNCIDNIHILYNLLLILIKHTAKAYYTVHVIILHIPDSAPKDTVRSLEVSSGSSEYSSTQ